MTPLGVPVRDDVSSLTKHLMMSTAEMALTLNLPAASVRRLLRQGRLPGKQWRGRWYGSPKFDQWAREQATKQSFVRRTFKWSWQIR